MTIRTTGQSRAAKAKGREAETAVVEYLRARGFAAERRRLSGEDDLGDVGGVRRLVIEVKATKRIDLPGWLSELAVEVGNANGKYPEDAPHTGIVVARRRGKPFPGEWFCCLTLDQMTDILLALGFK